MMITSHLQMMFYTASHMEYIHDHADYGFTASDVQFKWRSVASCYMYKFLLASISRLSSLSICYRVTLSSVCTGYQTVQKPKG